jgi:hypothetical protein
MYFGKKVYLAIGSASNDPDAIASWSLLARRRKRAPFSA